MQSSCVSNLLLWTSLSQPPNLYSWQVLLWLLKNQKERRARQRDLFRGLKQSLRSLELIECVCACLPLSASSTTKSSEIGSLNPAWPGRELSVGDTERDLPASSESPTSTISKSSKTSLMEPRSGFGSLNPAC